MCDTEMTMIAMHEQQVVHPHFLWGMMNIIKEIYFTMVWIANNKAMMRTPYSVVDMDKRKKGIVEIEMKRAFHLI